MRCSRLFIPFILLFAPLGAYAMTGDKAEFQKLADDVYAFVGKLNDANAMAIVTTQGVVVVDTGNNPPETRILQQFVQSVTPQPIRYVVITQNHGDHTGGTPLFSPPATAIVQDKVAKDWDRGAHLSATAATIYRELKGEGPEIAPYKERTAHVTITKIAEEGRFLTATTDDGKELHLRAAGDVDFEGIKDRSELALGMKLKVIYLEPANGNAPLGFDITELELERN